MYATKPRPTNCGWRFAKCRYVAQPIRCNSPITPYNRLIRPHSAEANRIRRRGRAAARAIYSKFVTRYRYVFGFSRRYSNQMLVWMQTSRNNRIQIDALNECCDMYPRRSVPRPRADLWRALVLAFGAVGQLAVVGAAANPAAPAAPFRAPYLPASDDDVLQEVPSSADPAVLAMRALRAAQSANPKDFESANRLANAYVDY